MRTHYCLVFPDPSRGRIYPTLISILIQINSKYVQFPTSPPHFSLHHHVLFPNLKNFGFLLLTENLLCPFLPKTSAIFPPCTSVSSSQALQRNSTAPGAPSSPDLLLPAWQHSYAHTLKSFQAGSHKHYCICPINMGTVFLMSQLVELNFV